MEFVRAKWRIISKLAFLGFVIFILFVAGYYSGLLKKNCKQDINCFNDNLKKCRPSMVLTLKNNNVYGYSIGYNLGNNCEVKIKLERVEVGASPEFRDLLEGKSMKCKIPKDRLENINLEQFDNLLQYCHGELKEGLYELIIKRMYSLVVSQLGDIVSKSKEVLREV